MSKILVDTIDTRSGTSTLTLGSSNAGTIALGSGDVQSNMLYPAWSVELSANQTFSSGASTSSSLDSLIGIPFKMFKRSPIDIFISSISFST